MDTKKCLEDILMAGSVIRGQIGNQPADKYIDHALRALAEAQVRELTTPRGKAPDMSGQDGYL